MAGALDQIVLNAQSARYTPQKLHGVDTLSDVLKDMQDTEREDALRKQLLAEKAEERAYQRDRDAKQDAITKEKLGWLRDEQAAKEAERQKLLDREAGLDIYNQGMLAGPKSMPEALQSRGILDTKGEQAKMLAEQSMWDGEVDTEFMPENIKAADYSKLPGRESEVQQMQRVIQETKAKGLKVPQAVYDKYYKAVDDADTKLGTSYKTALEDYEQAKKDVLKSENDSIKNLISVYKANSSGGSKAVDRYSKKTNDAVKVMNELVDDGLLTSEMQGEAFKRSTELMDLYDLTPEQVKALFRYGVKKDDGILGFFKGESKLDDNKIEKMKSALGITELKKVDKGAESSAVPSSIIKQIDDLRQVQMANLKAARNTFTTARDKYTKGVDRSALGEGVGTDLRELYRNVPEEVTTSSTKQTGKGGTSGSGKTKKPTEEPASEIDEVLGGVKQSVLGKPEIGSSSTLGDSFLKEASKAERLPLVSASDTKIIPTAPAAPIPAGPTKQEVLAPKDWVVKTAAELGKEAYNMTAGRIQDYFKNNDTSKIKAVGALANNAVASLTEIAGSPYTATKMLTDWFMTGESKGDSVFTKNAEIAKNTAITALNEAGITNPTQQQIALIGSELIMPGSMLRNAFKTSPKAVKSITEQLIAKYGDNPEALIKSGRFLDSTSSAGARAFTTTGKEVRLPPKVEQVYGY
jgi:hypothetical protein